MTRDKALEVIALGAGRRDGPLSAGTSIIKIPQYADPAAVALVNAIRNAFLGYGKALEGVRLSLVLLTESGCREVLSDYLRNCEEGFVSPARYAVASPAAMTGIACIAFSIHGPTLTLTSPVKRSLPIAIMLSRTWLLRRVADISIIARADGEASRCVVLSVQSESNAIAIPFNSAVDWISQPLASRDVFENNLDGQ